MKFSKNLIAALAVSFVFVVLGLIGPIAAHAATAVDFGTADSFAVLAGSAISDPAGGSAISGNVGLSPTGGTAITNLSCSDTTGSIYDTNAGYLGGHDSTTGCLISGAALLTTAKNDLVTAYNTARDQATTTVIVADLGGQTLTPGVYGADSSIGLTGTVTLNGQDDPNAVFIIKAGSTLTTAGASHVTLINQAQACNVFWQIGSSATLGSGSDFKGTILAMASITDTSGSTVLGRLLARNAAVTLNNTDVTKPTCVVAPTGGARYHGTINVVKVVINDNGGAKTVADFPLAVDGMFVASGVTNTFGASLREAFQYKVTETNDLYAETNDLNYTRVFSGDCDAGGVVYLNPNDNKFCIITNNDIGAPVVVPPVPPLIDMVKTASPLSLPAGPGSVVYTYTLRNIGTVPVTDVTIVGDTCSPIILASGDTNNDAKLDVNETWVNTCTQMLSATHTNTAVATGWANGISAVDIASATVVVGAPIVPPLIHLAKKPSVFTLAAPGGAVTYTYTVTNPGTEPLNNVSIADDKCTGLPGRVSGHPGDINKNDLLESNETWSFTCQSNLTQTTTNTGIAEGSANGLVARDFAIATVVVANAAPVLPKVAGTAVPMLPKAGFSPPAENIFWNIIILSIVFILDLALFVIVMLSRTINASSDSLAPLRYAPQFKFKMHNKHDR